MSVSTKIPVSKVFFPAIQTMISENMFQNLQRRYEDLYQKHGQVDNPALRRHLVNGILPGLALYQLIRESGKSQTEAIAAIDQIFKVLFLKKQRSMQKLGKLPFIYSFLRKYIKTAMRQYPAEGWTIEWTQNDSEAIRFNMKTCFYFNTLSSLGAPELTASFCQVDDNIYSDMSPNIQWVRTQTIARGSALCDFCFANANAPKNQKQQ